MTPLLSAIYEGHVDCVRLLLQKVTVSSDNMLSLLLKRRTNKEFALEVNASKKTRNSRIHLFLSKMVIIIS